MLLVGGQDWEAGKEHREALEDVQGWPGASAHSDSYIR